ncbi:MAG: cohesin domain-containing protein, partial [Specibacter sp.]
DVDFDPLTAIKVSDPLHGSLTFNSDGSFSYTPQVGFFGQDSFTYKANDGFVDGNVATVSLTVMARLSIPTNLVATPHGTVVVQVNIDNPNPVGSGGLVGAVLALNYDTAVFTVTNADVAVGTVTAGWNLSPNVPVVENGQMAIALSSGTPNTSFVGGSLALITFHVKGTASLGASAINLMASNSPTGQTVTTALDRQAGGQLPLLPPPSNADNDANVDGLVTITGATHFDVSAPVSATAGVGFMITVTALSATSSTATEYLGTVHLTSSDGQALLPADATLTGGVGTFNVTLKTAGNQTVTATDTASSPVTGTSNTIAVAAAAATHFSVAAPALGFSGAAFNVTLTALDAFENTAVSYTGTAHFTSSDGAALLPADYAFVGGDQGVRVFSVTLVTAGNQTLSATDTLTGSITGSAVVHVPVMLRLPTSLSGVRGGAVTAPLGVNGLVDLDQGHSGLAGGNFVLFYDTAIFEAVGVSDVQLGTVLAGSTGWGLSVNAATPGYLSIALSNDGSGIIGSTAGGSLVEVVFHIKSGAAYGPSPIDLAMNSLGGPPVTGIADQNFAEYLLAPTPQNGADVTDGVITVLNTNQAPLANNDAYNVTVRLTGTDPGTSFTNPGGVLSNDTDVDFDPL